MGEAEFPGDFSLSPKFRLKVGLRPYRRHEVKFGLDFGLRPNFGLRLLA